MRTNIVLDEELVAEAMRLSGLKTRRAVVHEALEVLVRLKKRRRLSDLKGKVRFADGYDHRKLRKARP
ncbi:MAG: type II toxin-antitoxin system VapB family antitoxin [Deltaproteobacteria bacterium]|nr:type II toxin-antitoxin system VapB family antitoxin [Deltaproteobacteria bacterium]